MGLHDQPPAPFVATEISEHQRGVDPQRRQRRGTRSHVRNDSPEVAILDGGCAGFVGVLVVVVPYIARHLKTPIDVHDQHTRPGIRRKHGVDLFRFLVELFAVARKLQVVILWNDAPPFRETGEHDGSNSVEYAINVRLQTYLGLALIRRRRDSQPNNAVRLEQTGQRFQLIRMNETGKRLINLGDTTDVQATPIR